MESNLESILPDARDGLTRKERVVLFGGWHNDPYSTLTPREQEVMRMLAEGLTSREVAKQLFISPKTVENHRTNLMKKLSLKSSVELVRYAARLGLIDIETWAI